MVFSAERYSDLPTKARTSPVRAFALCKASEVLKGKDSVSELSRMGEVQASNSGTGHIFADISMPPETGGSFSYSAASGVFPSSGIGRGLRGLRGLRGFSSGVSTSPLSGSSSAISGCSIRPGSFATTSCVFRRS